MTRFSTMLKYANKLREAAADEVASVKSKVLPKDYLKFDQDHKTSPLYDSAASEKFDADNWVARYAGQNVPHIGNGAGGVR